MNAELERQLRDRIATLERTADRVARENRHLTNMYVASYSLHETLDFERVLLLLKELIINMIGSEHFGIYLVSEHGDELELLAHEGFEPSEEKRARSAGPIARALDERTPIFATDAERDCGAPLVSIPLVAHGAAFGVIALYRLLDHKRELEPEDRELIEVLAERASSALHFSRIYTESDRRRA